MSSRLRSSIAAGVVALVALAGCGSKPTNAIRGHVLTIYAGMPLHGASRVQALAVIRGAELALSQTHARIGRYGIGFKILDDSIAKTGAWDPGQTTVNAHLAAGDRTTIGYLGDLDSGASAISIPVLNRAGIAQVSPSNTAVGLTSDAIGSTPGEPQKYYPTGKRTFARVVPNDLVQSTVQAMLQQDQGCATTYILDDQDVYGDELAMSFAAAAMARKLTVAGIDGYEPGATDYSSLVASVAASRAGCVFISAITEHSAVLLSTEIAAAMPRARIFVPDGAAESSYTDPLQGGIPLVDDPRVSITAPTLSPDYYPAAGRAFLLAYAARFGTPEPDAIYGYEAMSLLLDSIRRATDNGRGVAERSRVVAAIFGTRNRHSVLGTYSIDRNGDTTIRTYGTYRVVRGQLTFSAEMQG